jgi:type I restriction-modification system DNA methylase subunit
MQTKTEVLKACTVSGNHVYLPPVQLERNLYQEVNKSLQLIGGKWKGGKIAAFVFEQDPAQLLEQLQTGINKNRNGKPENLQKQYQFFATPSDIAAQLVEMAELELYDLILEPSAGQGAIIREIQKQSTEAVHYCELMPLNRTIIERDFTNVVYLTDNFLKLSRSKALFHKIIANPPFSDNQDIKHIECMFDCLAPGGKIVSIASKHWQFASDNKSKMFRSWLKSLYANITELPSGTFKESGTNIPTCIIEIEK